MESSKSKKGSTSIIFAERFRKLRGTSSQRDFAVRLGMNQPNVARYELGRVPKPDVLDDIASKCGVSVNWLLGSETGGVDQGKIRSLLTRVVKKNPATALEQLDETVKAMADAKGDARFQLIEEAETLLQIFRELISEQQSQPS